MCENSFFDFVLPFFDAQTKARFEKTNRMFRENSNDYSYPIVYIDIHIRKYSPGKNIIAHVYLRDEDLNIFTMFDSSAEIPSKVPLAVSIYELAEDDVDHLKNIFCKLKNITKLFLHAAYKINISEEEAKILVKSSPNLIHLELGKGEFSQNQTVELEEKAIQVFVENCQKIKKWRFVF